MRKMSKKSAVKWGVVALIVVALGALAYTFLKPKETTPNYLTATAEIGDIENNVMASGKVKALNTVDVGAQVSGEVKRLYVEVGDEVQQGDLIAQIDQVTQKNNLRKLTLASHFLNAYLLDSGSAPKFVRPISCFKKFW